MKLSPKQEDFCYHYVRLKNATEAAIKAGYSERTARTLGSKQLTNVDIQARIKEMREEILQKNEVTIDRIKKEYAKIAFANIQDFIEEDNTISKLKKLRRNKAAAIESITIVEQKTKEGTTTNIKLKLHPKTKALEDLGKHLGFFKEDNKQKKALIKIGYGTDTDQ